MSSYNRFDKNGLYNSPYDNQYYGKFDPYRNKYKYSSNYQNESADQKLDFSSLLEENSMSSYGSRSKIAKGTSVSLTDVQEGDVVTVTRDVIVSSVDTYDGVVIEKNTGNKIRLQQPRYGSSSGKKLPQYTAVMKEQKAVNPLHWPPQSGDVWEVHGSAYHIHQNPGSYDNTLYAYGVSGYKNALDDLKPTGKLVYRKGNALNV